MAWDKTLPTDATKIRVYPTTLTDNFKAVEEGDDTLQMWKMNFIERNAIPSAPPVTPTRIDDTMQIFSKQNPTTSLTDLFVLDDRGTANTIQLTEDGYLGGISQALALDSFTFDATRTFNEHNIVVAWGYVGSGGGAPAFGSGITNMARSALGTYTITWDAGLFSNTNYAVFGMATTNANVSWNGTTKTTGSFGIEVRAVSTGDKKDSGFFIMAVGGQV